MECHRTRAVQLSPVFMTRSCKLSVMYVHRFGDGIDLQVFCCLLLSLMEVFLHSDAHGPYPIGDFPCRDCGIHRYVLIY